MTKFFTTSFGLLFLVLIGNKVHASTTPPRWTDMKVVEFLEISTLELEERTGYAFKRSEKLTLRILRSKMRKAARKNPDITVAEFLSAQKSAGSVVLWILLGGLLVFFFLFLMLFTDDD